MIKRLIKESKIFGIYKALCKLVPKQYETIKGGLVIEGNYKGRFVKQIVGGGNKVICKGMSSFDGTVIHITGNNNTIIFEDGCSVGPKCSFWAEGSNITIRIGAHTTFTHTVHFCAQEDGLSIEVGEDCMFSNTITIRTSDSHIITDNATGERINPGKSVKIGNHVWIAPKSMVMKGVTVGNNVIIGTNTMVTKDIPDDSLAVGIPAKVVKTNISWHRQATFESSHQKIMQAYLDK